MRRAPFDRLAAAALAVAWLLSSCATALPSAPIGATVDRHELMRAYVDLVTMRDTKPTSRALLSAALDGVNAMVRDRGGVPSTIAFAPFTNLPDVVDEDFDRFYEILAGIAAHNPTLTSDEIVDAAIDAMTNVDSDCHTWYSTQPNVYLMPEAKGDVAVERRLLPDQIGYVAWDVWLEQAPGRVSAALDHLLQSGAKAWILDLRGNPGGLEGVEEQITGWFVAGEVYKLVGRNGVRTVRTDGRDLLPSKYQLPIAIIVDEHSYSASEFFAIALRSHYRAVVVGDHTRGCVGAGRVFQSRGTLSVTTDAGTGLRGEPYNNVGIAPDIPAGLDAIDVAADHLRDVILRRKPLIPTR